MPQEQQQKRKRAYAAADANTKPTLVCTGYVFKIGEGHLSSSEQYNVIPVEIQPYGGGRPVTFQFLSRPDWFTTGADGKPTFRPRSLKSAEGGKALEFVYSKMMNGKDGMSALEGLAGTDGRLERLEDAMLDSEGLDGEESVGVLQGIFENVFIARDGEEPVEIGYILKQAREKGDTVDENGKQDYILKPNYDLASFWQVTEKNKKKYRKIAEQSADRNKAKDEPVSFKVCFDEGVHAPF